MGWICICVKGRDIMLWKDHLKWGFVSTIILMAILIVMEYMQFEFFEFESIWEESRFMLFGMFALPNLVIAFIGGLYGSLFPDIDIGTSKAFATTYMILILICVYYAFTGFMIGLFVGLILMAFIIGLKHRGVMHKPYTAIIIGIITFMFFDSIFIALFFTVGFMVHLICDMGGDD